MTRVLLIIGALVALALLVRWFLKTPPHRVAIVLRRLGALLLLVVAIVLAFRGALALAVPLGLFALSLMGRRSWWPGGGWPGGSAGGASPRKSEVRTKMLRMELEHASGRMDGEILDRRFAGRWLSDLADAELDVLYDECAQAGDQSLKLLMAWLQRERPEWLQRRAQGGQQQQQGQQEQDRAGGGAADDAMTPERAREILGVGPDATEREIRAAHRRLMKVAHPDHGGSDWLARQLNLARDVLLKEVRKKRHGGG